MIVKRNLKFVDITAAKNAGGLELILENMDYAGSALENMLLKGRYQVLLKQAGNKGGLG